MERFFCSSFSVTRHGYWFGTREEFLFKGAETPSLRCSDVALLCMRHGGNVYGDCYRFAGIWVSLRSGITANRELLLQ